MPEKAVAEAARAGAGAPGRRLPSPSFAEAPVKAHAVVAALASTAAYARRL
ncbi:hypothetical protein [Streptomyces sp. NPDC006334]|uniref:hypothetical protein n=1 Tax=Streptomyces sp. NPDC006334 TaxID=3156754 RepID=UPI0033A693A1